MTIPWSIFINLFLLISISIGNGMNIVSKLEERKSQIENLLNLTAEVIEIAKTDHPILTAVHSVVQQRFGRNVIEDDIEMIKPVENNNSNLESPIGPLLEAIFKVNFQISTTYALDLWFFVLFLCFLDTDCYFRGCKKSSENSHWIDLCCSSSFH